MARSSICACWLEHDNTSFLPYYPLGNLQDLMTQVSVTGRQIDELRLLRLFHGTCLG